MTYLDLIHNADYKLSHNQITFGEYDRMIEPLRTEIPKKGKWIRITNGEMREKYICSECGRQIEEDGIEELIAIKYPYCHCGAEMSGGGEDEVSD